MNDICVPTKTHITIMIQKITIMTSHVNAFMVEGSSDLSERLHCRSGYQDSKLHLQEREVICVAVSLKFLPSQLYRLFEYVIWILLQALLVRNILER